MPVRPRYEMPVKPRYEMRVKPRYEMRVLVGRPGSQGRRSPRGYSARNVIAGSTRAAWRAGHQVANVAPAMTTMLTVT